MLSSPQSASAVGSGASESGASSKNELQGSLDVTICGLQRPQHQLLILDPHVPELLHLGLPAALSKAKASWLNTSMKEAHAPELGAGNVFFNKALKLNIPLSLQKHNRRFEIPQWIECSGFNLRPHLQSGHVGGLQRLLQGLAEEVITDWGPCRHGSCIVGGVSLNQRPRGGERRTTRLRCDKRSSGNIFLPSVRQTWRYSPGWRLLAWRRYCRGCWREPGPSPARSAWSAEAPPPRCDSAIWGACLLSLPLGWGVPLGSPVNKHSHMEEWHFELPHRRWVTHTLRLRDQAAWLTDWKSSSSSDMPSNMKPPAKGKVGTFEKNGKTSLWEWKKNSNSKHWVE